MAKKLFTEEELRVIHSAAHAVWNYIGYDILTAVAEDGGSSIPRSHVLELVCDASRLDEELGKKDKALAARWEALDYKTHLRLLKPAFSYTHYGM